MTVHVNGQVVVSHVSTLNSTATPLAGDAVFTGTAEDVSRYSSITVLAYSDVASAASGLAMQFSSDGTNWDRAKTVTCKAAESQAHSLLVIARYFRVVYTNGTGAQSSFRLQTIYHVAKERSLTSGTQQNLGPDEDVTLVRLTLDPRLETNFGRYNYISTVHKFGENPDIGTGAFEPIVSSGVLNWLQAATTVRIKAGGSGDDTAAGSGAQKVTVEGLDSTWAEASETITTNGASASTATSTSFIRINRAYVTDVGAYGGLNAAAITIENSAGGTDLIQIPAGLGQSEHCAYTVPAGKTAYLTHIHATWDSTKDGTMRMWQRRDADDVSTPFTAPRIVGEYPALSGDLHRDFESWPSFPAKTDIWMEGKANTSSGAASCSFDLYLVDV